MPTSRGVVGPRGFVWSPTGAPPPPPAAPAPAPPKSVGAPTPPPALTLTVAPPKPKAADEEEASPLVDEPQPTTQVLPLAVAVATLTHVRDASMLLLGGSVLHIAYNVISTEDDTPLSECVFLKWLPLLVLSLLWIATLVFAVSRIFGYLDGVVANTILDYSLVLLGAALQISVKPSGWINSGNDQLWCTVSSSSYGPTPLLVWILGEVLSFVSFGRSLADYALRPPCGAPAWLWVGGLIIVGFLSFPLVDLGITPLVREFVSDMHNASSVA